MKQEIYQQFEELYRKSFDDSPEYLQYFMKKVNADTLFASLEGERLVSAFCGFCRDLDFFGKSISCGYIVAACTLPEFRRQGRFRALFKEGLLQLKEKGLPLSVLSPFDDGFYQPFGYVNYSFAKKIDAAHLGNSFHIHEMPMEVEVLQNIYRNCMKNYQVSGFCYRDFADKCAEWRAEGSRVFCVQDGNARGILVKRKGKIEEYFGENDEVYNDLAVLYSNIQRPLHLDEWQDMQRGAGIVPQNMLKVLDFSIILPHVHSAVPVTVRIEDRFLEYAQTFQIAENAFALCDTQTPDIAITDTQLVGLILGKPVYKKDICLHADALHAFNLDAY